MINHTALKSQTAALQTEKMVGRQELLGRVNDAIDDKQNEYIFFFYGEGGIGKTCLLRAIGDAVENRQRKGSKRILWSGILDLYHSEMHSVSEIERALIEQLDPENEFFQVYRHKRQEFEEQRTAGMGGTSLEAERKALTRAFIDGYRRMASAYRIVLTFDTLELVQYESEDVQKLCEVESTTTSVRNWFLQQMPKFRNTVTVFAGRPHQQLQIDFAHYLGKAGQYIAQPIERLTEAEAKAFIGELAKKSPEIAKALDASLFPQVYGGSDSGRPIYLSLAADFLSRDLSFSLSEVFKDKERMRQRVAERLVNLPNVQGDAIYYLAFARMGLGAPLLVSLMEGTVSDKEAEQVIATLREYTFVKTSQHIKSKKDEPEQLFLHDEIFDVLDRYRLQDPAETQRTYTRIRDYYQQKRGELVERLDAMPSWATGNQQQEREAIQQQLEDVDVKLLYYELQVNPCRAYWRYYNRWTEEAIKSHRIDYDMRLRDMVLNFLRYIRARRTPRQEWLASQLDEDEIARNSAVLWVRRYIERGQYGKARQVAQKLRESSHPAFAWDQIDDPLYKGALQGVWGKASYYVGAAQSETLAILNEVPAVLENADNFQNEEKDEFWRRTRTLGFAHNNIGFTYRREHQYSTAIPYYQQAIALYRQVDVLSEMATTVTNLAFAYAQLGAIDEAESLADDAVDIWHRLGQPYNLALSLNARGLICLAADQPHRAKAFCQRAHTLFSSPLQNGGHVSDQRGQGLALLALGETWRRLAGLFFLNVYGEEDTVTFFTRGRDCLQTALEIFSQTDTFFMLDTHAELGRLYRDWTFMLQHTGQTQEAKERQHQAQSYLREAMAEAQRRNLKPREADIAQDLVSLYWSTHQRTKARDALERAEACIPAEYKLTPGQGFAHIDKPLNPYWQVLGKIYLLRALMSFEKLSSLAEAEKSDQTAFLREGVLHFVLAVACFEQYASFVSYSQSPKMKRTKATIYGQLKTYKASRLLDLMQFAHEVAASYYVTDQLQPTLDYLERTLGVSEDMIVDLDSTA